ncbi:hypothetical protein DTO013E5_7172 [Penicillium roqueforti]|uniref:Sulphonylurea receptor n=1 Tax=Penicillium roqueforti (strain FM164) TaxID=1365484 RepID=W6QJL5_PENRF|nr:hypothetical protein CBS147332_2228 [Penicillium roqueforti]CDM37008.1 Sulphonylurea receptor [Penicillium roqueforti FM164]KAI2736934.1 hypothetical protein DTO012A1_8058 [Penicillium roqueforti]KAI2750094.1 hypothetical protein DTO013F2_4929 [Penicillium roqueforti]KAI2771099.1 hypothetical protein DTO012A8_4030 [Penicillium roqueforti]
MALNASDTWDLCPQAADRHFGPSIDARCRGGFDFTLTFEQSILSIAPSALLLLIVPFRLYWLSRTSLKTNVSFSLACSSKLLAAVALFGVQVALLVLWGRNPQVQTVATIPAAALSLVDALSICLLSYMEHTRSIRPSTLLGVFLLASLVLDIPQSRTLFLMGDQTPMAAVFTAATGLKVILLMFEAQSKIHELRLPYRHHPPEATANVWARTLFWWLNPLFFRGFARLLSIEDLFSMDSKLATFHLRERMQASWARRAHSNSPYALIMATISCMRWALLSAVGPRLAKIGFTYAQPFLISRVISFVEAPASEQLRSHALGLMAAAFLVYISIAITTVLYKREMYRMIAMARGSLVSLVYSQTLQMPDSYDESAALTLMSTDIDRVTVGLQNIHEVWARITEIAIGMWLLVDQLGAVAVLPIGLIVVCTFANSQLSKLIVGKQKVWNAAVQKRIAITASMLGSMKSMKIMGMTEVVESSVQEYRRKEIQSAMGFRWLALWTNTIASAPLIFAPVLTFVVFVAQATARGTDSLSTNQAFTSLSIITLVTQPASLLMFAINESAAMKGCFDRLQKFLRAPAGSDSRGVTGLGGSRSGDSSLEVSLSHPNGTMREGEKVPETTTHSTPTIKVQQVTIRPAPTVDPAISQVSMDCPEGSLTLVVGPVGCGKSTLLRAVLGELPCDAGTIAISTKNIAFCAQSPWLPNGTIKDVICGFCDEEKIDHVWFQTTIHACALEEDLSQLPHAEQTVVGSRGVTLSGGQKQRVALARAVYARRSIILLDDVLSALDQKTEALVVDRLFGEQGLLRRLQTTILLVTHSVRHLNIADQVIVLTREGKVREVLSGQDIQKKKTDTATSDYDVAGAEDVASAPQPSSKPRPKIKAPGPDDADLTRQTGDMAVYAYYFRSFGWPRTFGFIACTALFTFATTFQQIWLQWWTNVNGGYIGKYMSVYVVLAVAAMLSRCLTFWWALIWMSPISSLNLHRILLRVAIGAPLSFFAKTDSGVILNQFSQDIGLIDRVLPLCLIRMVVQIFQILSQTALIAMGSSYMSVCIPICAVTVYWLQRFYLRTSRQLRFLDLESRSPLYSHFLETLEGLSTLRAFGWQEKFQETNTKLLDTTQRPFYLMYCIQCWLNLVLDLLVAAVGVVVIALAVLLPHMTSAGTIGLALNNVLGFNQALAVLIDSWTQLETSLGAIARLKNLEQTVKPEYQEGEDTIPPDTWPEHGAIELKEISASYSPSIPALKKISMSILPGQKVGICGRTGSGKSSLLLSLLRLLDLDSGSIAIDGYDLQTLPRELVRSRLVAIPQEPFFLSESVRINVDPSNKLPDEAIINALKKTKVWDAIEKRGGLDAQMKEQPLSQGEQQLFCLARTMLRSGKILILDEATSNVDAETDQVMQGIIRDEFQDYTVLTVAHRLDTIMDSDVVAVLDQGRLAEYGPPRDLLARPSMFADLVGRSSVESAVTTPSV